MEPPARLVRDVLWKSGCPIPKRRRNTARAKTAVGTALVLHGRETRQYEEILVSLAGLGSLLSSSIATTEQLARARELTCSDGTDFTEQQIRNGNGPPPHTRRNVNPSEFPVAFDFHAAIVTAPDGIIVEQFTWDHSQGIDNNMELITCSFIIPIGPPVGSRAAFVGFFIP